MKKQNKKKKKEIAIFIYNIKHIFNNINRAELGRATWHVLHSITSRFPEEPTEEESVNIKINLIIIIIL